MLKIFEVRASDGYDAHSHERTVALVTDYDEAKTIARRYESAHVTQTTVYDTDAEWAAANVTVIPAQEILP